MTREGTPVSSPLDVLVNGVLVHRLPAAGRQRHDVVLDPLPAGSVVELWLPQFGGFRLREAALEGANAAALPESGPRWVTYGSSLTQCQQADGPSETWPALVAARYGWELHNLGMAGECQLDPAVEETISALSADLISLCLGINSYNAATFSERTYASRIFGFVSAVRRAHPRTPLAVITPMPSAPREDRANAVGWTLEQYRQATEQVVGVLQKRGDARLHCIHGRDVLSPEEAQANMPDTLHPDNAGYRLMAQRLGPRLSAIYQGSFAATV
ncbi:MAG TPA: SGNH/GDSL hydrolase family protein [Micrococcaceae bacterium]|nr:SGNH/GDSL hydrolase family protein [Micrococcaceae bacterium]